jgi:hypothetical protein
MRPRGFLSAALIYGTILGLISVLVIWLLGVRGEPLEFLFIFVVFGLSLGLGIGYVEGPSTRTFDATEDFPDRLQDALRSLHYHLQDQSSAQLTYRIDSPLPWSGLVDVIVDTDATPLRVSGPRDMLRRLAKKLGQAGAST